MHPVVKAAGAVALLAAASSALALFAPRSNAPSPTASAASAPPDVAPTASAEAAGAESAPNAPAAVSSPALTPTPCPSGHLPGRGHAPCVALPSPADASRSARDRLLAREPAPRGLRLEPEREMIALLPDRPADFHRYQLPVEPLLRAEGPPAASDQPGVRLEASPSAPIALIDLEGQRGRPEVVAVGELYGVTVVVRHRVERPSGERDYLAFYGRLARPGPAIVAGTELSPLAVIGFAGDGGELYLETRELRDPLPGAVLHLSDLVSPLRGPPVDPRNVLPLRR